MANGFINEKLDKLNIEIVKKVFGGFGMLYLIFHYLIFQYFISYKVDLLVQSELIYALVQITSLGILVNSLICILIDPGCLNTPYQKQEFQRSIENKPELSLFKKNRNFCMICQIPKIARSQHCIYCKKCYARFETHSQTLNTCIAAYNLPFYVQYLFFISAYMITIFLVFCLETKTEYQKSITDLVLIIIISQQLYYFTQNYMMILLRITYNITSYELMSWRRYPYLWKNEVGQFGNPFDQGMLNNICQIYRPILNKVFFRKSELPTIDWGQVKFFNLPDIPGHPLSQKFQEQIQTQLQQQRMMEREYIKQHIVRESQQEEDRLLQEA